MSEFYGVLKGEDAMNLLAQGEKAWNEWVVRHEGWDVDFSRQIFDLSQYKLLFSGFVFLGSVSFNHSEFINGKMISFDGAQFRKGRASFRGAKFNAPSISFDDSIFCEKTVADFRYTTFEGHTSFFKTSFLGMCASFKSAIFNHDNTKFHKTSFMSNNVFFSHTKTKGDLLFDNCPWKVDNVINFENAECGGNLSMYDAKISGPKKIIFNGLKVGRSMILDKARFSVVPDFRNLTVERDVSMLDTVVEYKTNPSKGRKNWAEDAEHTEMYRKLKSMAVEAKDHEREIEFFAMEERAKKGWQHGRLRYLPTLLYDKVSNFGRYLLRPFIGLAITWVASAVAFQWILSKAPGFPQLESWLLSAIHLFPFFPWSRGAREDLIRAIGGASENESTFNACVEVTAYGESFLALIFIFLIGLALRNRFRM